MLFSLLKQVFIGSLWGKNVICNKEKPKEVTTLMFDTLLKLTTNLLFWKVGLIRTLSK